MKKKAAASRRKRGSTSQPWKWRRRSRRHKEPRWEPEPKATRGSRWRKSRIHIASEPPIYPAAATRTPREIYEPSKATDSSSSANPGSDRGEKSASAESGGGSGQEPRDRRKPWSLDLVGFSSFTNNILKKGLMAGVMKTMMMMMTVQTEPKHRRANWNWLFI